MSLLGIGNVNWNDVEDIGFKPLPAGQYGAKITKADLSATKAGTGKYIKLELTLVGNKGVKGRKIFEYLTIQHPSEQVVMIALAKLKKIIKAIGKNPDDVQDTSELLGELVAVKVKVATDEKYGPQNKIVDFEEFTEDLLNKTLDDEDSLF